MIILSAVSFEVEPLKQLAPHLQFLEFGIGPLNAARSCDRIATQVKNQNVLIIGTCGVFGEFCEIEVVSAKRCIWLPTSERMGHSWSIEGVSPPMEIAHSVSDLPQATVICCANISKTDVLDPEIRTQHQLSGVLVENLELYSILPALKEAKQVDVLFAITNKIGPEARIQWKENFKKASKLTANIAFSLLQQR